MTSKLLLCCWSHDGGFTHTHTHTGHPLTLKQENIGIKGWAVEARVYAEVRQA